MSKTKEPTYFGNRFSIAQFIGVSRMTLYRWERIHSLPKQGILGRHYILHMSDQEIIKWLRHLYRLLYGRKRYEFKYSIKEELRNVACSS